MSIEILTLIIAACQLHTANTYYISHVCHKKLITCVEETAGLTYAIRLSDCLKKD